jgi:cupin superfamily acireductone dioxygenase involved in methionine salvage
MSTYLTSDEASRLAKLCGMFGSDHDGERAAAAAKADQLIRERGLTWRDVILLPSASSNLTSDWQRMAAYCQAHHPKLNAKELKFVRTMLNWRGEPSEKQAKWLTDIFVRVGGTQR